MAGRPNSEFVNTDGPTFFDPDTIDDPAFLAMSSANSGGVNVDNVRNILITAQEINETVGNFDYDVDTDELAKALHDRHGITSAISLDDLNAVMDAARKSGVLMDQSFHAANGLTVNRQALEKVNEVIQALASP
jgi:hypothetical protein